MSTIESEVQEIELGMREAQKLIEKRDALSRLRNSADFKLIIEEGYLETEALNLIYRKGSYNNRDKVSQKLVDRDIFAITSFADYLNKIFQQGALAEDSIRSGKEELEDIYLEEQE